MDELRAVFTKEKSQFANQHIIFSPRITSTSRGTTARFHFTPHPPPPKPSYVPHTSLIRTSYDPYTSRQQMLSEMQLGVKLRLRMQRTYDRRAPHKGRFARAIFRSLFSVFWNVWQKGALSMADRGKARSGNEVVRIRGAVARLCSECSFAAKCDRGCLIFRSFSCNSGFCRCEKALCLIELYDPFVFGILYNGCCRCWLGWNVETTNFIKTAVLKWGLYCMYNTIVLINFWNRVSVIEN